MDRIVILGAGVAGLSAARRLLLLGHSPLLIAPQHIIMARGETLSPKALPYMEVVQWADLLDGEIALTGQGRFSIWGSAALRQAPAYEGQSFHIDRAQLEQRMSQSLAEMGVEHIVATASALEHRQDGVRITLNNNDVLETSALVDCTGRSAFSSGERAQRRRLDKLVAAWRILDLPDDSEILTATLIEAVALGWWYMSPMPGQRMMLGFFTDSDLLPSGMSREVSLMVDLCQETQAISARLASLGLEAALSSQAPAISPASSVTSPRLIEERILRAGDAAVAWDPLSANGLTTALWSGIKAAEAALAMVGNDFSAAHAYEQDFLAGIAHHLATQQAMYMAERRFLAEPFWSRRQQAFSA